MNHGGNLKYFTNSKNLQIPAKEIANIYESEKNTKQMQIQIKSALFKKSYNPKKLQQLVYMSANDIVLLNELPEKQFKKHKLQSSCSQSQKQYYQKNLQRILYQLQKSQLSLIKSQLSPIKSSLSPIKRTYYKWVLKFNHQQCYLFQSLSKQWQQTDKKILLVNQYNIIIKERFYRINVAHKDKNQGNVLEKLRAIGKKPLNQERLFRILKVDQYQLSKYQTVVVEECYQTEQAKSPQIFQQFYSLIQSKNYSPDILIEMAQRLINKEKPNIRFQCQLRILRNPELQNYDRKQIEQLLLEKFQFFTNLRQQKMPQTILQKFTTKLKQQRKLEQIQNERNKNQKQKEQIEQNFLQKIQKQEQQLLQKLSQLSIGEKIQKKQSQKSSKHVQKQSKILPSFQKLKKKRHDSDSDQ